MIPALGNSRHAKNPEQLGKGEHPLPSPQAIPQYLLLVPLPHGSVLDAPDLVSYDCVLPNHNFWSLGIAPGGGKAEVVFKVSREHCSEKMSILDNNLRF